MVLPKEIADLIERFDRNREAYKSGQYNEMQLRQEFLDPFFEALGWDMNNRQGYAEAYKDRDPEKVILYVFHWFRSTRSGRPSISSSMRLAFHCPISFVASR